jgi:hypothetical protein
MAAASQDPAASSPPRYRAISLWAVLSVACGAATTMMLFFGWLAALFPLAAIYFGLKGLGQIQRVPEEYSGQELARIGIGLGAGLGILLSGWLIFVSNEVPHGYKVLDWADLEPDPNKKNERVPSTALELGDPNKKTKVYVRGYIIPGRQQVRLKEFSMCRTSDQCRFSLRANRPTDLIHIELMGDRTMDYTTHEIGVGGIFQVDPESANGTPYHLKADYP